LVLISSLKAGLVTRLKISARLRKHAAQIEVLLMDVDGTMTDGGVTLLSETEEVAVEIKTFDAHDGQGLTLAHIAGLRTGRITGRQSSALLRRAKKPQVKASDVKTSIESALKRAAELDANQVKVTVVDDKVILRGSVRSWAERQEAERAAWSAPGVGSAQDDLSIAA
jgi:osmotically-inducible protein OsmY